MTAALHSHALQLWSSGIVVWLPDTFKRNGAIINVISYTCAPPAVARHNICAEIGPEERRYTEYVINCDIRGPSHQAGR